MVSRLSSILLLGAGLFQLATATPIASKAPAVTEIIEGVKAVPQQALVEVTGRKCGTAAPSEELLRHHAYLHATSHLEQRSGSHKTVNNNINVNVHFHVVSTSAQAGAITQTMVNNQFQVMQQSYAPAGISFNLASVDFTVNDAWAADSDDSAMKSALRQGGYRDLNIYFQTALSADGSGSSDEQLLGFCTLPTNITYVPCSGCKPRTFPAADWSGDGCNVHAGSMPGGWLSGYNMGKTAVHETGHWFGLLHVFQDSTCASGDPGDFIADTPQQSMATQGCPATQDSCPTCPGVDSIHNYMDYSDDACYESFTPDQVLRMHQMFNTLRRGH